MDANIIKFNNNLREKIKTRATQSMAYPLAQKLDLVTLTFDLENQ
jgi:hypothetical protein